MTRRIDRWKPVLTVSTRGNSGRDEEIPFHLLHGSVATPFDFRLFHPVTQEHDWGFQEDVKEVSG